MISASDFFQWRPMSDAARRPAPPPSGTEPIPVADSSAPESGNRASAPGRLWTILCIEDDPECSSLIGEELKERGFAVVLAHDGEEGLSLLLNSSVDLVLSDINMPGMSGFEVLEKFKELAPDSPIPFIFLTGLSDREDEIAGRMLGADDYVRKPVDFADFANDHRRAPERRGAVGPGIDEQYSERSGEGGPDLGRARQDARGNRPHDEHHQENRGVSSRQRPNQAGR